MCAGICFWCRITWEGKKENKRNFWQPGLRTTLFCWRERQICIWDSDFSESISRELKRGSFLFPPFRWVKKMPVAVVMEKENLQDIEYPVLLTSQPTQVPSFRCNSAIRPWRSVKNKTRRPAIPLRARCWSCGADFIYFFLILYEMFVQDHDWIAVGMILQCRLGMGWENEKCTTGGRDRIRFPQRAPKSKYSG